MKKVILVKNGEIVLKGLNRSTFEDILIKNKISRSQRIREILIKVPVMIIPALIHRIIIKAGHFIQIFLIYVPKQIPVLSLNSL